MKQRKFRAAASWRPRSGADGRHREPHHHQGPVRPGVGADRDRAPLRPHRRDLVVGLLARQGAKAAIDVINKGGGIAGRKVELVTEDTESNPPPGPASCAT